MVAADGIPPAHDTAMVTVRAAVVKTTRAAGAGPGATLPAVKPCCGLHDSNKAPAAEHWATTVPPDELSTVPPVAAVPPVLVPPVPVPAVPVFVPGLRGDPAGGDGRAAARPGGACTAAAAAEWAPAGEAEAPPPSSDTMYRPPAVAAAAPTTHAPAPITIRVRMLSASRTPR